MKLIVNGMDISKFYNKLTWSGEKSQAARKLDFGVVVSGTDKNLPKLSIMMDNKVFLFNDAGKMIFSGKVYDKDKSINSNIMTVNSIDPLIVANKSKDSFNFIDETPQSIATQAFSSIGIPVGNLASGSPLSRTFDVETIYNMVYIAYKMEHEKTGVPYMIRMNGDTAEVVEQGKIVAKYVLDGKYNLIDAIYGESMENAVSKVKIYDTDGKQVGEITDDSVGGFTEIYRQEKNEDANARAKALFKGIEKRASVKTFGDFDLITGNAVQIQEPFTGLIGKFFITSDTHTFENGIHMCELELSYDNIMEELGSMNKDDEVTGSGKRLSGSFVNKTLKAGESVAGAKYKWGGNNPKTGIDCSGFVQWSLEQAGAKIPGRLTSAELRNNPKKYGFEEIPFSSRQPGDVLWQSGHVALQYDAHQIIESGGVSKNIMGYSGVAISKSRGRTFSKAYRYVG